MRMDRAWPFLAYALALLAAGLFVERAFCRFLCPLGAVMAIGGKLRLRKFNALKRRQECGSPCQLCARRCPIQAIEPSGKINMDECFYCLDCQVIYHDAHVCPPLVVEARRNRKFAVGAPAQT
jgi:NosR/NirI family nitrous oxide reductase transcriptional regulator